MKRRNLDPRNAEQLYKDLHSYTKLPKKQQMVEYTSVWKEDGINFLSSTQILL